MSPKRKRRQRGTGHVQTRHTADGDTTFYVQFYGADGRQVKERAGKMDGYDLEGMPPFGTRGRASEGWTKPKAEKYLRHRIHEVEKDKWKRPEAVTFAAYADAWVERKKTVRGWTDRTVVVYRLNIKHLKTYFGEMKLGDIREKDVDDFISKASETYAPRTVNLRINVLHSILKSAKKEHLVPANVAAERERPKITAYDARVLTPGEARAVENALREAGKEQERLAFVTFETLGLRFHELQGLQWRDIDFVDGYLTVRKSKSEAGRRVVPLPDALLEQFIAHLERVNYKQADDYVFHHPEIGSKWHSRFYREAMKAALAAAGIEGPFRVSHDLRVTSATYGMLAGETVAETMERGGWSSIGQMKPYVKMSKLLSREKANKLAEIRQA